MNRTKADTLNRLLLALADNRDGAREQDYSVIFNHMLKKEHAGEETAANVAFHLDELIKAL